MNLIMNILWIIFGGLIQAFLWAIAGIFWCATIVGIPFGIQCFKMAGLILAPFGKQVSVSSNTGSVFLNVLWILLTGVPLAISFGINGLICCATIIGIPFGLQCFKFAKLAFMPFGATIA